MHMEKTSIEAQQFSFGRKRPGFFGQILTFVSTKNDNMSLPVNNKKANSQTAKNQNTGGKGSKFIKGATKAVGATKKVRSTGANRGS